MTNRNTMLTLAVLATAMAFSAVAASASEGLEAVMPHYEKVRLRLVEDSIDGIRAPAESLRIALEGLNEELTPRAAGVTADELDTIVNLLPEAIEASRQLERAQNLQEARDAFFALTQPLVRWRQAAGEGPVVVFCPMAKRSWLQADGEQIGNPYNGQMMATCGEIIDE